jgi:proline-specific peptidase
MNRLLTITLFVFVFSCKNEVTTNKHIDYTNNEYWDEWRLYTKDGTSLFAREFGTGDTITILHGGWGAEHSYLIEAFAPFANKYHFIFYDQRGSLRSQCPDSLISIDNHIEDVERIRKATGQKKLLLIGHSMGGFLAMNYLNKYPDNVKGLILISSAPAKGNIKQLSEDIQGPALKRWERQEVIDTLKANGLNIKDWGTYKGKRNGTTHRITFAALNMHHVKNWRKLQSAFDWHESSAVIAATSGPQEWDFTEDLKKANFLLTVIHGDDDYLPIDYQKAWIPNVPNAELKTIKDAGHLCWIDQPDEFGQLLLDALKKYNK